MAHNSANRWTTCSREADSQKHHTEWIKSVWKGHIPTLPFKWHFETVMTNSAGTEIRPIVAKHLGWCKEIYHKVMKELLRVMGIFYILIMVMVTEQYSCKGEFYFMEIIPQQTNNQTAIPTKEQSMVLGKQTCSIWALFSSTQVFRLANYSFPHSCPKFDCLYLISQVHKTFSQSSFFLLKLLR